MLNKVTSLLVLIYICSYILLGNGDRIKDSMYLKIAGSFGCYRRMNSTHQIGCSSERGGSVGIIHYCNNLSDLDDVLQNGTAGRYIPILPTSLFSREIIAKLISSQDKVAGLVLYPIINETLPNFSHESTCPNNHFSVEGTCPKDYGGWNPWGTDLLYADIPFPMFYIQDENEVETIKKCFQKFNNVSYEAQGDRPLCSLELSSFMYATTSTPTCKRRSNIVTNLNPVKLCDPLGDQNVWGSLFPLVEGEKENRKPVRDYKYVVVAARMDTTSLFDKTAGAESPITGTVALLTVAKLLKEMLPGNKTIDVKKNVLFILFNGETYDYIGSQRLLYDMERGEFPTDLPPNNDILPTIYPDNITLFIELSQLTPGKATYAHYLGNNKLITNFVQNLTRNKPSNLDLAPTPNSLPPSSLHTFIRGNTSIEGLVLADHELEYRNRFYNSLYDNASNIGYRYYNGSEIPEGSVQKYVGDVATMVARSVFEEIIGESYSGNATVQLAIVDELFHCYLEDPNCKIHQATQNGSLPKSPFSLYVGVSVVDNFFTSLAALTLAWFIGDNIGEAGPNCTNLNKSHVFRYYNMSSSIDNLDDRRCYRTTINVTEAVSPAFIIEDYDWSSNKYSSWSESTWNDMGMRMFLRPSRAHEHTTFAIGTVTMIFSFVVVYFIKARSHILFGFPQVVDDPPVNC